MYRSPEALSGAPPSFSDDVWALGVTFHILLTGQFPFSTNEDDRLRELVSRGLLHEDVKAHLNQLRVSSDAADLLAKLLASDPAKRISIEMALRHPFVAAEANQDRSSQARQVLQAEDFYDCCERFQNSPRLHRIVKTAAARLLVDDTRGQRAEPAHTAFLELDKGGNGRITHTDLRDFFLASGSFMPSASWFTGLASGCPALAEPQDLGISYTAFIAATLDDMQISNDDQLCRTIFDLLDTGRDGTICANDLRQRLGLSARDAEQVVNEPLAQLRSSSEKLAEEDLTFSAFLNFMHVAAPQVTRGASTKGVAP